VVPLLLPPSTLSFLDRAQSIFRVEMNITHQLSAERCPYSADNHFGPVVSPQCRDFDFTLYFEQAFLSLTPSVIFIFASLVYLPTLTRQTTKVRTDRLHGVKLVGVSVREKGLVTDGLRRLLPSMQLRSLL